MNLRKTILIWLLIIVAESINGTIREFIIAPEWGDHRAHQTGFVTGSALILFIAWLTAPWLNAKTLKTQLQAGSVWLVLLIAFEFGMGYVSGYTWEYMLAHYNPVQGGLMWLGLIIMLLAPAIGARLRIMFK